MSMCGIKNKKGVQKLTLNAKLSQRITTDAICRRVWPKWFSYRLSSTACVKGQVAALFRADKRRSCWTARNFTRRSW